MKKTMRAVRAHAFGGPEVLRLDLIDVPTPGPDELLLKVSASGVNQVDWKFREGYLQALVPRDLPVTIGWDVAGTIEAVGSGVTGWTTGDAVIARPDPAAGGTHAEFVVVRAAEVARKPSRLSFDEAAALPLAGLTAHAVLIGQGGLRSGEHVLILGGSGGVGHLAVQIAKAQGAWVAATTSAGNADFVRSLGADYVIDYETLGRETLPKMDLIVDLVGPSALALQVERVRDGGRIRSIVAPPELDGQQVVRGLDAAFVYAPPDGRTLDVIASMADDRRLRPSLQQVFSLEQAAEALEASRIGRTRGKAVFRVAA